MFILIEEANGMAEEVRVIAVSEMIEPLLEAAFNDYHTDLGPCECALHDGAWAGDPFSLNGLSISLGDGNISLKYIIVPLPAAAIAAIKATEPTQTIVV